jgi:hypothetical protein
MASGARFIEDNMTRNDDAAKFARLRLMVRRPVLDNARGEEALPHARSVGQAIYVDPELKLVLVHTAVAKKASINNDSMGAELSALWYGLVNTFGRW